MADPESYWPLFTANQVAELMQEAMRSNYFGEAIDEFRRAYCRKE